MNEITMAAAGLLLVLVGAGIGYLLGRRGRSDATSKLEETRTEFDDYRRDVTRHFDKTAQQFQSIGQQYRELYEHMAKGAETFCVPTEPGSTLPFSAQSRLPTDAEEAENVIDESAERVAESQPKDHVVLESADEDLTAASEEPAASDGESSDEALEVQVASDTAADESVDSESAAEASAESEDAADPEDSPSVEAAPENAPDKSDRIYH